MTSWYRKDVGDGVEAYQPSKDLQDAFLILAASKSIPVVSGVFSVYDSESNLVKWYFSPGTEILANQFGAVKCEKPDPYDDFGLLVGNNECWETFFPGHEREQS